MLHGRDALRRKVVWNLGRCAWDKAHCGERAGAPMFASDRSLCAHSRSARHSCHLHFAERSRPGHRNLADPADGEGLAEASRQALRHGGLLNTFRQQVALALPGFNRDLHVPPKMCRRSVTSPLGRRLVPPSSTDMPKAAEWPSRPRWGGTFLQLHDTVPLCYFEYTSW